MRNLLVKLAKPRLYERKQLTKSTEIEAIEFQDDDKELQEVTRLALRGITQTPNGVDLPILTPEEFSDDFCKRGILAAVKPFTVPLLHGQTFAHSQEFGIRNFVSSMNIKQRQKWKKCTRNGNYKTF